MPINRELKTSQAGVDLIKEFEGFSSRVYLCPAGKPTIGYGHLISKGEDIDGPITIEKAEELLRDDLKWAEDAVHRYITHPGLNQNQFDALVSFTFNLGAGALRVSTLRRLLNSKQVIAASNEFKKWNKVRVGRHLISVTGLTRRRAAEAALFLKS